MTTKAPPIPPRPFRFTHKQYYEMGKLGYFDGKRVELIFGEIIEMSPIGWLHHADVMQPADGAHFDDFSEDEFDPLAVEVTKFTHLVVLLVGEPEWSGWYWWRFRSHKSPPVFQCSVTSFPHEINHPAATNVRCVCIAAMVQDVVVVTTGVLKCIRKYRHGAEIARVVHRANQ